MKRIHAIALNTAVDMRMVVSRFEYGAVIRSQAYAEFASGKAVNSARAVSCLGGSALLYCFSGPNDTDLFSSVASGVDSTVVTVEEPTRRNLTLLTGQRDLVCHIQNHGYEVTKSELERLEQPLHENIGPDDIVILSGSLPKGISTSYVEILLGNLNKAGARVVLDMDADILKEIDTGLAHLVKPNREELSRLHGGELSQPTEIVEAACDLIRSNIIVVSLGSSGAVWIDRKGGFYAQGRTEPARNGDGDVIGCGDAMVGGFALGMAQDLSATDIFKMGICSGYANIFRDGPGMLSAEHYEGAMETVELDEPQKLRTRSQTYF